MKPLGFDIAFSFSTRDQRFTFIRLLDSYLTRSSPAFSLTLTTMALYQCSLRWFEACSCKPAPRGLPLSFMRLRGALSPTSPQHLAVEELRITIMNYS